MLEREKEAGRQRVCKRERQTRERERLRKRIIDRKTKRYLRQYERGRGG